MGFLKKIWNFILNLDKKGKKWIGNDGLLNMETAALITLLLLCFFPIWWSMFFTLIIMLVKSFLDMSKGHEKEYHDIICASIGIIIGAIIGCVLIL